MLSIPILLMGLALMPGAQASSGTCLRALEAQPADAIPASEKFERNDCPGKRPPSAFRYDAAQGISHLSRAVAKDEIVPAYPEFGEKLVRPGQILSMIVLAGNSRIQRRVQALQAARPGQLLFVRSADGQVLSARYEERP
jgi:flagella basal body P-ring formation protein FlgA